MELSDIKYYKAIGKLQTHISKSGTFEEALVGGLKIVLESSVADYAIIWYKTGEEYTSPYYWICPNDITSVKYRMGEGLVGKTISLGKTQFSKEFTAAEDEKIVESLNGIDISSICSVPFEVGEDFKGCIEFIKVKGGGVFNDEDANVLEILSMLVQMSLTEDAPSFKCVEEREVLVSARDIKKSFKNGEIYTQVLKGINLDIFKGEMLCLLGESGCGKSTMLNIIGGLINADSGSLTFEDKELIGLSEEKMTAFRRDNVGFIFQSYNLMPNLNAKQNLDLIAELVKEPMPTDEALKLVGLSEKAGSYPSQLSGGQQQRISIARAMVKRPKLILADEPTAALDYETSIGVLKAFEKIKNSTTILMVTHNEAITKMADRIIRFRNGKTYEITVNRHPLRAEELVW